MNLRFHLRVWADVQAGPADVINDLVTKQPYLIGEEKKNMKKLVNLAWALRIWKDRRGQDLIEYALMAGFVAVAAGAIMPGVATSITTIFSKISSSMAVAATQGS